MIVGSCSGLGKEVDKLAGKDPTKIRRALCYVLMPFLRITTIVQEKKISVHQR